jgi:hypothetical protein
MRLQVEQLEKEKKELTERVRVAAKRLDHIERAYRKEERPLLASDYEKQQAEDKAAHEIAQKSRIESAKLAHQQDLETKKRLLRIMTDWKAYRETIINKRGDEFAKRKAAAQKKIDEEKAKKRAAVFKQREEERLRLEEEERIRREQEEEERMRLEGQLIFSIFYLQCTHASILQRSAAAQKKKKPPQRLLGWKRRLRSARLRRSPQRLAVVAKQIELQLRSKLVSRCNAKKKLSVIDSFDELRNVRPVKHLLSPTRTTYGDVQVLLQLLLPPLATQHRCLPILLYQNTVLVLWVQQEVGEQEKPRKVQEKRLVLKYHGQLPLLSGLLLEKKRPQRKRMASRRCHPRMCGSRNVVAGPNSPDVV